METKKQNIDPNSEWYRIDPYTKQPFMATHRRQIYLNAKTKNDFHNKKKYLQRHDKDGWKLIKNPYFSLIEGGKVGDVIKEQEKDVIELEPFMEEILADLKPEVPAPTEAIILIDKKRNTEQMLANCLGENLEVQFEWEKLVELGVDLMLFDSIEPLPYCHLKKANYGNYSVVWVSMDKVLITKQKNLLWTNLVK